MPRLKNKNKKRAGCECKECTPSCGISRTTDKYSHLKYEMEQGFENNDEVKVKSSIDEALKEMLHLPQETIKEE